MARKAYALYRRGGANGVLYAQVWDAAAEKYLSAKSTGTRNIVKARAVAARLVAAHQESRKCPEDPLLMDFLRETWSYETSPYVQAVLRRRPQGITKGYVQSNLSFIDRYAKPYFKKVRRSEVTPSLLEGFQNQLQRTTRLSAKSINCVFDAVAIPLRHAHRLDLIPKDPTRPIRKLWVPLVEKGIPTSAEIEALGAAEWKDERARLAFLLAVTCGLRLGEIRALQPEDIGADSLCVRHSFSVTDGLKSSKNGRTRIVPLPGFIRDELRRLGASKPHEGPWIFWGNSVDTPVAISVIVGGFYAALLAIGIDDKARTERIISFHSLRHFCNSALRGEVPDAKLRMLLGHRSENMTNWYDHLMDVDLDKMRSAQERRLTSIVRTSA